MSTKLPQRILVVDDMPSIHDDFRKILMPTALADRLAQDEALLFGTARPVEEKRYEVDSAYQGSEALRMVTEAARVQRPYALAFIDMRMPPGWDGIETTERLWQADAGLEVVICTAYSDIAWPQVERRLSAGHRVTLLRKPFDPAEAVALAQRFAVPRN